MISREDHLFGLLAVKSGLVDPVAFLDVWGSLTSNERLADLLVGRGLLSVEDRDHVAYLVRRKLPASASLAATVDSLPTDSPDRYEYLDICGAGGMGEVWRARDTRLDREVAIKELKRDLAGNESLRTRFVREVRLTCKLDHPGVVPVYDVITDGGGRPRYAMRLLRGRTMAEAIRILHKRRKEGEDVPLQRAELLQAFVAVCNTVGYAHSRGVLHRDLKPANVHLGDFGEVVVLDWGLAGLRQFEPASDCDVRVTSPGSVFGTPEYMAPEQATGDVANVNERSDIYGLGAILYQLLTGSPPFRGESMCETLALVRAGELVPVHQRSADVPAGLEAICHKALSRRPQDRFSSASELAAAVLQWQECERQAAERALRESEERFRTLFEAVPQSLWIARVDGWIEFYNRRGPMAILSQWSAEQFLGFGWKSFIHPDDVELQQQAWERAQATGNPYEAEFRWRPRDGSYRWVLQRAVPLRDGSGRIVQWYGSGTDINDLKEALSQRDEALASARASEQRYRLLTELIPQNIWTATPDGKLDYHNQRGLDLVGRKMEQIEGDGWHSIVHPEDLQCCLDTWQRSLTTGEPSEFEFRVRDAEGSYRWYLSRAVPVRDEMGHIVSWFGTNTDIQVLKEAVHQRDSLLQRLRAQEAEYRTILDSIPQIVWTATPDDDNTFLNRRWYEYTGLSREDSYGGELWKTQLHPDDRKASADAWSQSAVRGEPFVVEYRLLGVDGKYRWFLGRGVPLRDEAGQIVKWFGTATDIDDRKRDELHQHEAQATN